MAKKSTFLNMTLTLFILTAVSALLLGYVYQKTEKPIQESKDKKLQEIINIVVPGADNGEVKEYKIEYLGDSINLYTVSVNNEIIGTAIKSFSKNGFSGKMTVMVGFDNEGNIIDSDVLEHSETPGLGDKTSKKVSEWNKQFIGKNPERNNLKVKKDDDKGEIDGITAATISSRAYIDAIKIAYDVFQKFNVEKITDNNQTNQ